MLNFPASFRQKQIKQSYSCSITHQNPLLVTYATYSLQNLIAFKTQVSTLFQCGNSLIHILTLLIYTFFKIYLAKLCLFFSFSFFYFYNIYEPMQNIQNIVTRTNVCMYIVICNTVICLEYSIIMTTGNIYICTVRKSRYNNHKVMYS